MQAKWCATSYRSVGRRKQLLFPPILTVGYVNFYNSLCIYKNRYALYMSLEENVEGYIPSRKWLGQEALSGLFWYLCSYQHLYMGFVCEEKFFGSSPVHPLIPCAVFPHPQCCSPYLFSFNSAQSWTWCCQPPSSLSPSWKWVHVQVAGQERKVYF